jgi:squalene synthase HpnC
MSHQKMSAGEAFAHCKSIATSHYENFPVGSILIPKRERKYFYALYAFMRTADDFADLPSSGSSSERLEKLANWRSNLDDIYINKTPTHPVFIALAETIHKYGFEKELFTRLLDAFEFDAKGEVQFVTYSDLRWYTARSADPVGELVLGLFGYKDKELISLSDEICSGLQLLNFIQDLAEDVRNTRYYLPTEDCDRFGVTQKEIGLGGERVDKLVLYEIVKTEEMIGRGARLAELVSGRLRFELRAVVFGARRMIRKIRQENGDVLSKRPKLSKSEHVYILLQSLATKAV